MNENENLNNLGNIENIGNPVIPEFERQAFKRANNMGEQRSNILKSALKKERDADESRKKTNQLPVQFRMGSINYNIAETEVDFVEKKESLDKDRDLSQGNCLIFFPDFYQVDLL
jgi:hypothetical protein